MHVGSSTTFLFYAKDGDDSGMCTQQCKDSHTGEQVFIALAYVTVQLALIYISP